MTSSIGQRIEKRRKLMKLSRAEVGAAAGCSEQAVGQWERGEVQDISAERLVGAARKLKCSVEYLVTGKGAPTPMDDTVNVARASEGSAPPSIDPDVLERAIEKLLEAATELASDQPRFKRHLVPLKLKPGLAPMLASIYSELRAGKSVSDATTSRILEALMVGNAVNKDHR